MSYEFYKMLHVISIVLFFALFASAAVKAQNKIDFKLEKILTGVMIFLILLGGFGLKKYAASGVWPLWLVLKLGIWVVVGSSAHLVLKRFPQFSIKFFWASVGLLTAASYLANYKL
jgi:uncharacterized membrane protein SirB2